MTKFLSGTEIWLYIEKLTNWPMPIDKGSLVVLCGEENSHLCEIPSIVGEKTTAYLEYYSESLLQVPDSVKFLAFQLEKERVIFRPTDFACDHFIKKRLWFGEAEKSPCLTIKLQMRRVNVEGGKVLRAALPICRLVLEEPYFTENDQIRGIAILNQNHKEQSGRLVITARGSRSQSQYYWAKGKKAKKSQTRRRIVTEQLFLEAVNTCDQAKHGLYIVPFLLNTRNLTFTHDDRHTRCIYGLSAAYDRGRLHRKVEF